MGNSTDSIGSGTMSPMIGGLGPSMPEKNTGGAERSSDTETSISNLAKTRLGALINGPRNDSTGRSGGVPLPPPLPNTTRAPLMDSPLHAPTGNDGGIDTSAQPESAVTTERVDAAFQPLVKDGLIDKEHARDVFKGETGNTKDAVKEYVLDKLYEYFTGTGSGAVRIGNGELTKDGIEAHLKVKIAELLNEGERTLKLKDISGQALDMVDGIVGKAGVADDMKEAVARLVSKVLNDDEFIRKEFGPLANVPDNQLGQFLAESVTSLVTKTNGQVVAMTAKHFDAPKSDKPVNPSDLNAARIGSGVICKQGTNTCFIMSLVNALMTTEAGRNRLSSLFAEDGHLMLGGGKVKMLGGRAGLSSFETTVSTVYKNTYHTEFTLGEQGFAEHVAVMFGLERPNGSSASVGLKGNEPILSGDRLDVMIKVSDALKAGQVPILFTGVRTDTGSKGHYMAAVGTYCDGPGSFGLIVNDSVDGTQKRFDLSGLSLGKNEVCEVQFYTMGLPEHAEPRAEPRNEVVSGPPSDDGVLKGTTGRNDPSPSIPEPKAESRQGGPEKPGSMDVKPREEMDAVSAAKVLAGIEADIEATRLEIESGVGDAGALQTRMNELFSRWSDVKSGIDRQFFEKWIDVERTQGASGKGPIEAYGEIRDAIGSNTTLTPEDRSRLLDRLVGAFRDGIAKQYGRTVASDHRLASLGRDMVATGNVSDQALQGLLDRAEQVRNYVAGVDDIVKRHGKWDTATIGNFRDAALGVLTRADVATRDLNDMSDDLAAMIDGSKGAGIVYTKVPAEQRRDFLQVVADYCSYGDNILDQSFILSRLGEMRKLQPEGPITPDTFFKACTGKAVPEGFENAAMDDRRDIVGNGLRNMLLETLSERGIGNALFRRKVVAEVHSSVVKGVPYETALKRAVEKVNDAVRLYEASVDAVVKDHLKKWYQESGDPAIWSDDDAMNFRGAMREMLNVNPMLINTKPDDMKEMLEKSADLIDGMLRGKSAGFVYKQARPEQRKDFLQVVACYCNIPNDALSQSFILSRLGEMRKLQPKGPISPETFFGVCFNKRNVFSDFFDEEDYGRRQDFVKQRLDDAFEARLSKCSEPFNREYRDIRWNAERIVTDGKHDYDWVMDNAVLEIVVKEARRKHVDWNDDKVSNFGNMMLEVSREDVTDKDMTQVRARFADMIDGRNGMGFVYTHVPEGQRRDFLQVLACYGNMTERGATSVAVSNPNDPLHQSFILSRLGEMRKLQPKGPIRLETFFKACFGNEKVPNEVRNEGYRMRQRFIDVEMDAAIKDTLQSKYGVVAEDARVTVLKDACMLANCGVPYEKALSFAVARFRNPEAGADFDLGALAGLGVDLTFPPETHTLEAGTTRLFGPAEDNDFMNMDGRDAYRIDHRVRITMHEGKKTTVFRNDGPDDGKRASLGINALCTSPEQRRVLTWMLTTSSPVQREARRLMAYRGLSLPVPAPFNIDIRRNGNDLIVKFDLPKGFGAAFSGSFRIRNDGTGETIGLDCRLAPDDGVRAAIEDEYREELDEVRRGKSGDVVAERLMERIMEQSKSRSFREDLDPETFKTMAKEVRDEVLAQSR